MYLSKLKNLEKSTDLKMVYRLYGDDILMIEKACKKIETLCDLQMPELDKAVFTDENFDVENVLLSCQQLPFMSLKRLIIVKNIDKLKSEEQKRLEEYCKNPVESSVLVLQENMGGTAFSKLTTEKVHCKKLEVNELAQIVQSATINSGHKITPEAVNLLIEFCGKDLLCIQNSLSKLLYCGETEITAEVVKKLVKKSDEYSIFEISTALTYGQGDKAIVLMKKMLETMEFPVILGLISAHFRRMLYALISEGSAEEIAEKLGVKEFAISKAKTLGKNISASKLLRIYNLILSLDYDIKSGKFSAENAMYYLVFQIIDIIKEKND